MPHPFGLYNLAWNCALTFQPLSCLNYSESLPSEGTEKRKSPWRQISLYATWLVFMTTFLFFSQAWQDNSQRASSTCESHIWWSNPVFQRKRWPSNRNGPSDRWLRHYVIEYHSCCMLCWLVLFSVLCLLLQRVVSFPTLSFLSHKDSNTEVKRKGIRYAHL